MENALIFLVAPAGALIALIFAFLFYKKIIKISEGTEQMIEIAEAVRRGAKAYLKQQYKIVIIFFAIAFAFLGFLSFGLGVQSKWTPFAFLTGGFFSGLAGFIGMITATLSSARTTNMARESLDKALKSTRNALDVARRKEAGELLSVDLGEAYHQLGLILGESVEDDVLDRIFSEFCIGK